MQLHSPIHSVPSAGSIGHLLPNMAGYVELKSGVWSAAHYQFSMLQAAEAELPSWLGFSLFC